MASTAEASRNSTSRDSRAPKAPRLCSSTITGQGGQAPTAAASLEGAGASSSELAASPAVEAALEKDDILISILQRASTASGSYQHALVCRRWRDLSPKAQLSLHVKHLKNIPESHLIAAIRNFPNLTRIRLSQSIPRMTDFFLGALAILLPNLEHLELEGRAYLANDATTGEGWTSLFRNMPNLRTFVYSGFREGHVVESLALLTRLERFQAEAVDSVPHCLGQLTTLRHLNIMGTWDSNIELPSSISSLVNLQSLTLCSGSLTPLPDEVGSLGSLTSLSLELYNAFSIPGTLGLLSQLRSLRLEVCLELAELPQELANLSQLKELRLCNLPGLHTLPSALLRPSLEVLELRNCPMLPLPGS